jgi:hypothetical protein
MGGECHAVILPSALSPTWDVMLCIRSSVMPNSCNLDAIPWRRTRAYLAIASRKQSFSSASESTDFPFDLSRSGGVSRLDIRTLHLPPVDARRSISRTNRRCLSPGHSSNPSRRMWRTRGSSLERSCTDISSNFSNTGSVACRLPTYSS